MSALQGLSVLYIIIDDTPQCTEQMYVYIVHCRSAPAAVISDPVVWNPFMQDVTYTCIYMHVISRYIFTCMCVRTYSISFLCYSVLYSVTKYGITLYMYMYVHVHVYTCI